jgi:hypothetical protein
VSELQGIGRFKFQRGGLEEFKRLAAQCIEIVRAKDTGTFAGQGEANSEPTPAAREFVFKAADGKVPS